MEITKKAASDGLMDSISTLRGMEDSIRKSTSSFPTSNVSAL